MKEKIKNIVILGAAESGVGAAVLAKAKGYNVFVSDKGKVTDLYKNDLDNYGIAWEESQHTEEIILSADLIIKSPGIPHKAEIIKKAFAKGIPVISEIEFGSWFTDAKIIGITGTNGKTTTTSLTYYILKNAGLNVGLGGNIGKSFARSVAEDNFDYYVLEISSFQLDDLISYKNFIGVLLNITPDHLDRYNYNYEEYIKAKFKITNAQTEDDYFVYNYDDEEIRKFLLQYRPKARLIPFSLTEELVPGAFIKNEEIHIQTSIKDKNEFSMKADDLSLKGKHNRYNTMAAGLVSKILDVRKEVIRESLRSFQNAEHRLEHVAQVDGVDYINDSKATNVNSAWYALESINRPIIWIAGGEDKGNDYESLKPLAKERVKALICLGVNNQKLHDSFAREVKTITDASSMDEAVQKAHKLADAGDIVLLSPACASFDLFKNYEDRGRQFKQAVVSL